MCSLGVRLLVFLALAVCTAFSQTQKLAPLVVTAISDTSITYSWTDASKSPSYTVSLSELDQTAYSPRWTGSTTTAEVTDLDPFTIYYAQVCIGNDGDASCIYSDFTVASTSAQVVTLAGNTEPGDIADGTGEDASFRTPRGLFVEESTGYLYVVDTANNATRVIDSEGYVSTPGYTFSMYTPYSIVEDAAGNYIITDFGNSRIISVDPTTLTITRTLVGPASGASVDGTPGTCKNPTGLKRLANGDIYFSEVAGKLRVISASSGAVKTVVNMPGSGFYGLGLDADTNTVYFGNNSAVMAYAGGAVKVMAGGSVTGFADGASASAKFNIPVSVQPMADGSLLVADYVNNAVRRITTEGITVPFLGGNSAITKFTSGSGTKAGFTTGPGDLLVDPRFGGGVAYVSDNAGVRLIYGIPPVAPDIKLVIPAGRSVLFTWSTNFPAIAIDEFSAEVYDMKGKQVTSTSGLVNSWQAENLLYGTQYQFLVSASNIYGDGESNSTYFWTPLCPNTTCGSNGMCNNSGVCICNKNFEGVTCERCDSTHFGFPKCNIFCDNSTTCNNNGACNSTGKCVCNANYFGANCKQYCDKTTCGSYGSCDAQGFCTCTTGFYGPKCNSLCPLTQCSGAGICTTDTTTCVCNDGVIGATCSQCKPNDYYAFPTCKYCNAAVSCTSRGSCDVNGTCVCNAALGFYGPSCDQCGQGHFVGYNETLNATVCAECPLGWVSAGAPATQCTQCPGGYYAAQNNSACLKCPQGSVSQAGAVVCFACSAGYAANSSVCELCPPGTVAPYRSDICTVCPAGSYASNASSCAKCPVNTYAAVESQAYCTPCNPYEYSPVGALGCKQCYNSLLVPNITSISPADSIPAAGGNITIIGVNFATTTSSVACAPTVLFGDTDTCKVVKFTSTAIICTAPPFPSGATSTEVDITVYMNTTVFTDPVEFHYSKCAIQNGGCGANMTCSVNKLTLAVSCAPYVCGDKICQPSIGETCVNCPSDCAAPCDLCGDGTCDSTIGEDCLSCMIDCPAPCGYCGDNFCSNLETRRSCPIDCAITPPVCPGGVAGINATTGNKTTLYCNNHGTCNPTTATCLCSSGYYGPACNATVTPMNVDFSGPPFVKFTAKSDSTVSYAVAVANLIEYDVHGAVVKQVSVPTVGVTKSTTTYSSVTTYSANITNGAQVVIVMNQFNAPGVVTFAGEQIAVHPNSLKMTITVKSWPFQSYNNFFALGLNFQNFNGARPANAGLCGGPADDMTIQRDNSNNVRAIQLNAKGHMLFTQFAQYANVDSARRLLSIKTTNSSSSVWTIQFKSSAFLKQIVVDPNFSILDGTNYVTPTCPVSSSSEDLASESDSYGKDPDNHVSAAHTNTNIIVSSTALLFAAIVVVAAML